MNHFLTKYIRLIQLNSVNNKMFYAYLKIIDWQNKVNKAEQKN